MVIYTDRCISNHGIFLGKNIVLQGPVVQKPVCLTLGLLKIQRKFFQPFVCEFKSIFEAFCLDQ